MLEACPDTPLIRARGLPLGPPAPDRAQPGLTALHAGASYHRLAVIGEVADAYCRDAALAAEELAYRALLTAPAGGAPPRDAAARFYQVAVALDPGLAEAWFNQARLDQHRGEHAVALAGFGRALALPPHPRASAHAALHANAHFHKACILEGLGRDAEALAAYRAALALLDNFGVHHARIAHFLRHQGLIAEAIPQFEKLMAYGHRYFPEFTLPPLAPAASPAPASATLEVLYEASDGALVVAHAGSYVRVPAGAIPVTPERLAAIEKADAVVAASPLRRLRGFVERLAGGPRPPTLPRRADNMAALEPGMAQAADKPR